MRIFFCRKWKHRHPGAAKYKTQLGCWGQCCLCPAVVLHWRGPGVCFGQFWGFLISFHKFLFPENSTADSTVNNKEFELILSSKFNLVQCSAPRLREWHHCLFGYMSKKYSCTFWTPVFSLLQLMKHKFLPIFTSFASRHLQHLLP